MRCGKGSKAPFGGLWSGWPPVTEEIGSGRGQAWCGRLWLATARRGEARCGAVGSGKVLESPLGGSRWNGRQRLMREAKGRVRHGKAWLVGAWCSSVGRVAVRQSKARRGLYPEGGVYCLIYNKT